MKLYTDLDGTLITTKSGKTFPQDNDDWKFIPNILSTLVKYCTSNKVKEIVIITNQAGIDEGYHRPLDILYKISVIVDNIKHYFKLNNADIKIDYQISTALNSFNRKPFKMENVSGVMVGDASGINYKKEVKDQDIIQKARKFIKEGEFKDHKNLYSIEVVEENPHFLAFFDTLRKEVGFKVYKVRRDFSDSDRQHAELNGLKYIDYEDFIEQWKL